MSARHGLFAVSLALLFCAVVQGTPVQWSTGSGGNGNYYEVVANASKMTWSDAKTAAEGWEYMGLSGHLVSVTSSAENSFVAALLMGIDNSAYGGGFQPAGSAEPAGGWTWTTGEAWVYTHWGAGEPNNSGPTGPENALEIRSSAYGGTWNDYDAEFAALDTFIVEYIPEPATLSLLAAGLGGLLLRRKRK